MDLYKELNFLNNILADLDKKNPSGETAPEINQILGISALRSNDLSKAHYYFQQLLQSGNKDAYLFLGLIEELTGNRENAEKNYMILVSEGSKHGMYQMGHLEIKKGNLDKAETYFEKALYLGLECALDEITAIKTIQREIDEEKKKKVAPLSVVYSMLFGPVYFLIRQRFDFAFLNVWLISLLIISFQRTFPELQYFGLVIGNFIVSLFVAFTKREKKKAKNNQLNIFH